MSPAVARLRRYVVAGLLVWAPVGATIFVFRLLLGLMERLLFWMPAQYRPEALLDLPIPGLNAIVSGILAFLILVATGMLAANLIGKRLVALYESLLDRIPFVRSVYGAVKHFIEIVFSDTSQSFKRVLLIEYPRKGVYSLCFQTSDEPGEVQARTGDEVLTVFVPTTPNPTSGFILFVPRNEVVELDMPVEDALKMIVSLGVVVPKWHPAHPDSRNAAGELLPRPEAPGEDGAAVARSKAAP
ncbi:MAG: DUF502 domain-containing protein [Gammaproteobacteria bacterium]